MKNELRSISFEDYCRIDAVHKSALTEIERSPAHYKWACENPKAPTPAMVIGSAFHTLVLEPDLFASQYYCAQETIRRGTKKWDELEAEACGRIILKPDEHEELHVMGKQIKAHPMASECLLACDERETSAFWTDTITGELCKGRLDALSQADAIIVDLKTTEDASPFGFEKSILAYKYHWQAAFYCDGMQQITGREHTFVLLAVEKSAPFGVGVYVLGKELLGLGRSQYRAALAKVAECKAKNSWPCYSEQAIELSGPEWLRKGIV